MDYISGSRLVVRGPVWGRRTQCMEPFDHLGIYLQ